jgi:hypothetical protein
MNGQMAYSTMSTSNLWSPKATIPGTPSRGLAPDTAPTFISDGNLLYLFARGKDNELYETVKSGNGAFSSWSQWTYDARVLGRISAGVTHPPINILTGVAQASEIHVAFVSGTDSVLYRSFYLNGVVSTTHEWSGVSDGTVGTDGASTVGVALRRTNAVEMWWGHSGIRGGRTWAVLGTRTASGSDGQVTDISNVVYFDYAFQVSYSLRTLAGSTITFGALQLKHARFRPGASDDGFERVVFSTSAPAAPLPSELRIYRNLLVMAYADMNGIVRYSRWDTADPRTPWVGGSAIGLGQQAGGRPAMATINVRSSINDFKKRGFGNDLLAAIRGSGFADTQYFFTNFSQEVARLEVGGQIGIFNAYTTLGELSDGTPVTSCPVPPYSVTPTHVSLSSEGRPVLSEIGDELWMLPNWLSSHIFLEAGRLAWSDKSPYFTNYRSSLAPLVLMCDNPNEFVSDFGSTWIRVYDDNWAIFQEFGHQLAGAIGFHDDSSGPNQNDANRSGISLDALKQGYTLFGTSSNSCANVPRCVGFTDLQYEWLNAPGNAPSRQHHFLYVVLDYIQRGDELRQWIQDDIDGTNTATQGHTGERYLLQQKYQWILWNIFKGVEFGQAGLLKTAF